MKTQSHAEMNQAINDPTYRLECRLDELESVREPSFGSFRIDDTIEPEKPPYVEEPRWKKWQWGVVEQLKKKNQQLEAEHIHWRKQHAESLLAIGKLEKLLIKKNDDFIYG